MDILGTVTSLMWPFLFCYFANLATDRVSYVCDTIYDPSWFDQPIDMQKYVILMIARSQERIYFTGLGLMSCSMAVFGNVYIKSNHYFDIFPFDFD